MAHILVGIDISQDILVLTAEIVGKERETMYEDLLSVPGIGPKTAAALILCTNGFADFEDSRQLGAYVGLSLRVFEPGTGVKGKGHLLKHAACITARKMLGGFHCVE